MLMGAKVTTILGQGKIVGSERGLCYFSIYRNMSDMGDWLAVHFPQQEITWLPEFPLLAQAAKQLNEYLAGDRRSFTIPLDLKGTPFQTKVWTKLLAISYGSTTTYGALAAVAGHTRAARAVGGAMRTNPLPIFVPCHRVLRADGSLGHYGGGKELKRWLLQLEGAKVD